MGFFEGVFVLESGLGIGFQDVLMGFVGGVLV